MSRCDGRCCVVLHLNRSLDDLRADSMAGNKDAYRLSRMLIPVGTEEAQDMCRRHGITGALDEGFTHYRCRWWDSTTTLCTNYAERPSMCRRYPYEGPCPHCGETDNGTGR